MKMSLLVLQLNMIEIYSIVQPEIEFDIFIFITNFEYNDLI